MIREFRHAVLLGTVEVGVLHQKGDHVRFEFIPSYWEMVNRPVLGAWFEDNPRAVPSAALRLPAWFSNLLPEGQLRDWIARDRGVSPEREMELLLQVGHDLPGAVRVVPGAGADLPWRGKTQDSASGGGVIAGERIKFSLAGVGLKFSMRKQGERFTLPASGESGEWIVKLPDPVHAGVPDNEFAMMSFARGVGIDIPEIHRVHRDNFVNLPDQVWARGEEFAYAVRRFDRPPTGRVHMEDFAQVRGFYPAGTSPDKYSGSFETVAALCYRGSDIESLHEFVRRLTFNILIGNGDAHLKNWTLLYRDGRRATLSPAYDIVSTAPYAGPGRDEDLGLSWGGTRRIDAASIVPFNRLGRLLGLENGGLADIAYDTVRRAAGLWDPACLPSQLEFVGRWISASLPGVLRRF